MGRSGVELIKRRDTNYAYKLRVRWYNRSTALNDDRDILEAVFDPYFRDNGKKRRKDSKNSLSMKQRTDEPCIDEIDTDTILVTFPSLTKKRKLNNRF